MNLLPYAAVWSVLAVVVIVLAIMRKNLASKEDDLLHLGEQDVAMSTNQMQLAKKLDSIDKWGKILTVVLALTGLVLAVIYGLQMWEATSRVGLS
jgi:cytochrome b subunit of formate dehydrogenase